MFKIDPSKKPKNFKTCLKNLPTIMFHPLALSWYQLRHIWQNPNEKASDSRINQLQRIRGCLEAPIQLIIQSWLILSLNILSNRRLSVTDWYGNTVFLPFMGTPISITFSCLALLKPVYRINHIKKPHPERMMFNLLLLPALISATFFNLGALLIGLTYMNDFAFVWPSFAFLSNVLINLFYTVGNWLSIIFFANIFLCRW